MNRVRLHPIMTIESNCQVETLLCLLSGILDQHHGLALEIDRYEKTFLYCIAWSLGGALVEGDRNMFDSFLRTLTTNMPPQKVCDTLMRTRHAVRHPATQKIATIESVISRMKVLLKPFTNIL